MTRLKNTKAFTLIELIVVIVIIGILAAVAAVSYNSFIGNANNSASQSVIAQAAKAFQADSAFAQAKYSAYAQAAAVPADAATASATTKWQTDLANVEALVITNNATTGNTTLTVDTAGGYTCSIDFKSDSMGTSPVAAVGDTTCTTTTTKLIQP